jgi:hypothetical protein
MSSRRPISSRLAERGSALMIVFVLAAMVAIMLYKEMPVAAFEARRNKEELLVERGEEYKHAVKLYVRKLKTFPPSIEALETTNRMRFLRHKFDDPMTGKSDWRLIHAGPGGIILDSKVLANNGVPGGAPGLGANNPGSMANSQTNATGATGAATSFGNTGSSSFGSGSSSFGSSGSSFGSSGSSFGSNPNQPSTASSFGSFGNSGFSSFGGNSSTAQGPTVAAVPQRAPAVSAAMPAGGATAGGPGDPFAPGSDSNQPLDPNAPRPPASPTPNADTPGANASNDQQAQMRNLLGNQNPASGITPSPNGAALGSTGNMASGGLAGVASIAKGKTIKIVNSQSDFSLWEFYYDMAKDAAATQAGALAGGSGLSGNTPSQLGSASSGFTTGTSSFGASSPSSFGSSAVNGTSPSNQSAQPNTPPATPPPSPQ